MISSQVWVNDRVENLWHSIMAIKSNKRLMVCTGGIMRQSQKLEFGNYYIRLGTSQITNKNSKIFIPDDSKLRLK